MSNNIEQAINNKKRIIDLENEVQQQTKEVFEVMRQIIQGVVTAGENDEVSVSSTENSITAQIYDTTIGCVLLNGVALLRDDQLVPKAELDYMEFNDYWNIIQNDDTKEYVTGMIIIYAQEPETRKVVISRFYVNNNKRVMFRKSVGWHTIEFVEGELKTKLQPLIESSIATALFERENAWNHNHQVFDDVAELGITNRIGFRQ